MAPKTRETLPEKTHVGGDDMRRSLDLLWGAQGPGRRGPKQRLSTDEVVRAAIDVADAEGLPVLSMRRVADVLGVSPMSLYTYVPSRDELVGLMMDRVLGETEDPPAEEDWRTALTFVARERWRLAERHPWILDMMARRPSLGPNLVGKHEIAMRALDDTPLDELTKDYALDTLQNYLVGAMREAREAREVVRDSGLTDEQWFAMAEPALMVHMDPERFPRILRLGDAFRAAGWEASDPERRFEFGLAIVLDGIEALIRRAESKAE
jgi:AcrR family transcriptional regulator